MTSPRSIAAVLAVAMLALPACSSGSSPKACTQIGCSSGATLNLDAFAGTDRVVTQATVCIDTKCDTQRGTVANPVAVASAVTSITTETSVTVKVVVRGAGGQVLATSSIRTRLHKVQPNGPDCEPICFVADVHLTRAGKLATGAA